MAAGKINLQANDGKMLGLYAPDGMSVNTDIVPASVNGDATKTFKVADAVNGDEAVSKAQLDTTNTWSPNDNRAKTALNASGTAPIYACRAWVNFDGTGTVAIRASGNVSSITDNGTGDYTVNSAIAMPDANFSVAGSAGDYGIQIGTRIFGASKPTISSVNITIATVNSALIDMNNISVAIFR